MPVIKVWCLPKLSQSRLQKVYKSIVNATVAIAELGLKEEDITVLFPTDAMKHRLRKEIIIEVNGLYQKPERTLIVRNGLAGSLGRAVKKQFPKATVECLIHPFKETQGFWSSKNPSL